MTDDDALPDAPDEPDRLLLDALAAALPPAGPSDDLIARCEPLLTWADVDAELAELLEQAPAELAGTRGGGTSADLEFTLDDGSCVIELRLGDEALHGQILGVAPERVTLRVVTGTTTAADVDPVGSFEIPLPPTGSARIEIQLDGERRIHTDWFVI